ncbi:MAG: type II toxin-antitoxin system death-on-curing family toxin [Planctomycetota bacterium]|nr:type II toxin-antitoxin system death-on-curing family toxin [Planctomycetota bacterium]
MISDPNTCTHLSVSMVMQIHAAAIRKFGGSPGVRDQTLVESAVAAPKATFGGKSVYTDTIEVSAAYLFYLCGNHPFVDGNKRTALGACLVHLQLNGYLPIPDGEHWEKLTLDVACGVLTRDAVTTRLGTLLQ